jgi:hypothetical protein
MKNSNKIMAVIVILVVIYIAIQLLSPKYEVYCINGARPITYRPKEYWNSILTQLGAVKANYKQLEDAQKAGAEWCSAGFMEDGTCAWPRQTYATGCGGPPIVKGCPPGGTTGSVTAYGIKPPKDKAITPQYEISPFNSKKWSQYD